MQDLPGLIGGDSRELSRLVSDTVSYIDPAFPNLEFHRRAAMDTAGYFMPGYKPQVISIITVSREERALGSSCRFPDERDSRIRGGKGLASYFFPVAFATTFDPMVQSRRR